MNTILEKLSQIERKGESRIDKTIINLTKEVETTLRANIHLCNFCKLSPSTCKGEVLETGNFKPNNDNIVSCLTFKK